MASNELDINLVEHRHLDSLQAMEVITYVSADYTADYRNDIIVVDSTAGNVTVTLPKSRGGKVFHVIKSVAANTVTVAFSSGETMFGQTSVSLVDLGSGKRLKSVLNGFIPL